MKNVRLIFSGNEELQTGMVDENGIAVVRFADLGAEVQGKLVKHLCK